MASVDEPVQGPTLDAAGRFVVPGLIDAHVHLAFDSSPDPTGPVRRSEHVELVELSLRNARAALDAGITTVRDLGAPLAAIVAVARAIDADERSGPDVVFAGAAITRIGGHIGLLGGEAADDRAARAIAERQIDAGARAIKVVVSGGGLTPGTRPDRAELTSSIVRAAVAVGRERDVRVAAHAHATAAIRRAVDAGVDTIEHGSFVAADGVVRFDRDLAFRLRDRGMAVVPTASGALRTAERYRAAGAVNPADRNAIDRLEARRWLTGELRAVGVRIVAGTDAGVIGTPFDSLHDELAVYAEVGLTPAEALRTATSAAADALGLADRGRIDVGLRADFLLLDEDPLLDLAALRRPAAIVANGRLVTAGR
jgi:imidazolonepropionase-like amidohydrolase